MKINCAAVALLSFAIVTQAVAQEPVRSAQPAQPAQAVAPKRLCVESDLNGDFVIAEWKENPPTEESAWYKEYPFQYMVFSGGQKI